VFRGGQTEQPLDQNMVNVVEGLRQQGAHDLPSSPFAWPTRNTTFPGGTATAAGALGADTAAEAGCATATTAQNGTAVSAGLRPAGGQAGPRRAGGGRVSL
jgi:hypothetical protein